MWIRYSMLAIIGFAGGLIVAAGVYAFITLLGVINRLASRTKTAKYIKFYETAVILGGIFGNTCFVFKFHLPFGIVGLSLFGVFSGLFIGCQAIALAEVLDVMPVFAKRLRIRYGIPLIIAGIAVGKLVGAFLQLCIWEKK